MPTSHERALIWPRAEAEVGDILAIVNEAAEAYRDLIPADCFAEPYMTAQELSIPAGGTV